MSWFSQDRSAGRCGGLNRRLARERHRSIL